MEEETIEEGAPGGWERWKRSVSEFARSFFSLFSIRWNMATREAGAWGRAMAIRAALFLLAAAFVVFAAALLVAGLVAVLTAWWGTLVGAIFAVFGLCVAGAAALFFFATRRRPESRLFSRTAEELRRDLDAFSGPGS